MAARHDRSMSLRLVEQRVEWREDGIYLTGWAEIVLDGTWTGETPNAEPNLNTN